MSDKVPNESLLDEALRRCKSAFWAVFALSCVMNLQMLFAPLYSLQVLDRVIGSGNLYTLLMLSGLAIFNIYIHSLLQATRSFVLIKIGEWLDNFLSPKIFSSSIAASASRMNAGSTQLLRDFQTFKSFITGIGVNTVFDAPWSIMFLMVVLLIHHYIWYLTVLGALLIVLLAYLNAVVTNAILGEGTNLNVIAMNTADAGHRNAEVVAAMGMGDNLTKLWGKLNSMVLHKQSIASYRNGVLANMAKFAGSGVTIGVTGICAWIIVSTAHQDMTTGTMIACSIFVGKTYAQVNNIFVIWKGFASAKKAYKNLKSFFDNFRQREQSIYLSFVEGRISVENVYYTHSAPKAAAQTELGRYVLRGVSFNLNPGERLAVIGPSGAGKSTLVRLIVGVWRSSSGTVRLDGADVFTWNRTNFGQHVGYLPQSSELFNTSIKKNIARLAHDPSPEEVMKAAKLAGAHDMILRLPDGYDTEVGPGGGRLSGGQRQRIALARAFYGNPKLLVLDEPDLNLDQAGEAALLLAMKEASKNKITTIVVSHRYTILSEVEKVLFLQNGAVASFGTRDEVHNHMRMLSEKKANEPAS